ncbi:MAG: T9SS type A sorting domain-containing protein [Candidatus Eisenbacteria bacterium]|uniref:T9SS type A sorting domain-containing protein n=1 Tax=Eiseniibacteriota bacterium TaxID=2212470 RepID=A0A956NI08_UNCEI|nr:T9SS type A sorting domain-containing protein [Candidatus Eisenbacteria bacterium]
MSRRAAFVTLCLLAGFGILESDFAVAALPEGASWRVYRPANTGIMGDYSNALYVGPDGDPWIGGYDPLFEEGGFSRFVQSENRWENYSNIDHTILGSPSDVGNSRISDIEPDGDGGLWLAMWRGALYFDPAVGPDSFVRYTASNSAIPPGFITNAAVAPDGTVWFAARPVDWGTGGLAQLDPTTGTWKRWNWVSTQNGWPSWNSADQIAIQPKPGGGYTVWVENEAVIGLIGYDSTTETFTSMGGDARSIPKSHATDAVGNTWFARYVDGSDPYKLDCRHVDGTWANPPEPGGGIGDDIWAFRAFGNGQALLVDGGSNVWRFDGTSWTSLGIWRAGGFTYAVDIDEVGNVWVSGIGGAAVRSVETGQWQRYRITNTSQMDNFLWDISLAPNGDVWTTANAAPGIGGISKFDGTRWHCHNEYHYGLGEDWPFLADNADQITVRPSNGQVVFNPTFNGVAEWNGSDYDILDSGATTSMGLVEDSDGRIWSTGEYFSLRYHDETGFHSVGIEGWGNGISRDPERPGTVWACASNEVARTDGTYRFSRKVNQLAGLNPQEDVLLGAVADADGVAWVGTTNGLYRLDATSGTYQRLHPGNSDIPGEYITPLLVSPDGKLWFSNFLSTGVEWALCWYDGTEFGTVQTVDGLPHAQIDDGEVRSVPGGYEIWLACASRGIAVLTVPVSDPSDVVIGPETGAGIQLAQNAPNPFANATSLRFSLERTANISLRVFDVSGRNVRTIADRSFGAGSHTEDWDGRDDQGAPVPSGVYFYRLDVDSRVVGQKTMTLLR